MILVLGFTSKFSVYASGKTYGNKTQKVSNAYPDQYHFLYQAHFNDHSGEIVDLMDLGFASCNFAGRPSSSFGSE